MSLNEVFCLGKRSELTHKLFTRPRLLSKVCVCFLCLLSLTKKHFHCTLLLVTVFNLIQNLVFLVLQSFLRWLRIATFSTFLRVPLEWKTYLLLIDKVLSHTNQGFWVSLNEHCGLNSLLVFLFFENFISVFFWKKNWGT